MFPFQFRLPKRGHMNDPNSDPFCASFLVFFSFNHHFIVKWKWQVHIVPFTFKVVVAVVEIFQRFLSWIN